MLQWEFVRLDSYYALGVTEISLPPSHLRSAHNIDCGAACGSVAGALNCSSFCYFYKEWTRAGDDSSCCSLVCLRRSWPRRGDLRSGLLACCFVFFLDFTVWVSPPVDNMYLFIAIFFYSLSQGYRGSMDLQYVCDTFNINWPTGRRCPSLEVIGFCKCANHLCRLVQVEERLWHVNWLQRVVELGVRCLPFS